MATPSILFLGDASRAAETLQPGSQLYRDLNLDQIIAAVIKGKAAYDLAPYFHQPLSNLEGIRYRQEVFADLEDPAINDTLDRFAAEKLVAKNAYRVKDLQEDDLGYNHYHRERYFLNAIEQYCRAVADLEAGLSASSLGSRALVALREYLSGYVGSAEFRALTGETDSLERDLDEIRYCVLVKGDRVTVGAFDDEADYSEQVAATFDRFRHGAVEEYLPEFRDTDSFAGAGVLDLVAKVFPEVFARLDAFCHAHVGYLDGTLGLLDRELQFYLSYCEHIAGLHGNGLAFSRPTLSSTDKSERVYDTFDLALAAQLVANETPVVCNDITLNGPERILVVSGPNNGGKTTLARTFGQLHYLARLGLPVPGREARLFVCDRILTHFEKEEQIATLAGKLQDELNRLKADFDEATPSSVIILNEVFNSTSAQDALFLSERLLERVTDLDALCVCVTFLDELASLNEKIVSMVSTVVPDDPATRTYKLVRKPADGKAYARAIAEKYGLTFDRLTAEIGA